MEFETGATRDVLQNHLLQLLALTAMEEPVSFDAKDLRAEKEKVLSAVRLRSSTGSIPSSSPTSSMCCSRPQQTWGAVGARTEPEGCWFV